MFKIYHTDPNALLPDDEKMIPHAKGLIIIGNWQESFYSSLKFWNPQDYERHWKEAAARLRQGAPSSCFITTFEESAIEGYPVCDVWPVYRVGTEFHVQNRFLGKDNVGRITDPWKLHEHLGPYQVCEDGDKLFDLKLPLDAFDSM